MSFDYKSIEHVHPDGSCTWTVLEVDQAKADKDISARSIAKYESWEEMSAFMDGLDWLGLRKRLLLVRANSLTHNGDELSEAS